MLLPGEQVLLVAHSIRYIGKEADQIEQTEILGLSKSIRRISLTNPH